MVSRSRRSSTKEETRKKVLPIWGQEGDGVELVQDEGQEGGDGPASEEEEEVDDWVSDDENDKDLVEEAAADDEDQNDGDGAGNDAGSQGQERLDESVEGDLGIRKELGRVYVKLDSDDDEGEPMSEEEEVADS